MTTPPLISRLRQSALVAAYLLTAFATNAMAETFPLGDVVPASVSDEQRDAIQSQAQKLADGMYGHLLLRLDEVDRVCDLTDDQERILTVSAKGVVQEKLDDWLIELTTKLSSVDHMPRLNAPFEVDFLRGPKPFLVGDVHMIVNGKLERKHFKGFVHRPNIPALIQIANNVDHVAFRDLVIDERGPEHLLHAPLDLLLSKISEHELWKSTLERTLNDQQMKLYTAAQVDRAALPKEWRHERVMVAFDRMLRLDSSQRAPLAERVGKFLEMSQIKLWLKRRQGFDDEALAKMALRAIPTDDVKEFLSERQLEHWKLLLRQDLESR